MLSFPEQVGQLLIIGLEANCWNRDLEQFLLRVNPGGVIFFRRNIQAPEEFQRLVWQVQDHLNIPPFLAMDLEGGQIDHLRDAIAPLPAPREVAKAGLAGTMGSIAGRELAAFSLNVNLAPVLDLASPESADVLGSRAAGNSPLEVVRFAEDFLAGLAESGVLGCGKHFPGLGSGQKDSHRELPCINKAEAELWLEDLLPFRALAFKLPMIMVSHAWYPRLEVSLAAAAEMADQPLPASLSPQIVSRLLKGRIGFEGLVLSDDLEMGAILEHRTIEEAAIAAVRAGCDMALVCCHAGNVEKTFEALYREACQDPSFRGIVEQTAEKVILAKKNLRIAERQQARSDPDWEALRRAVRELTARVQQRLSARTEVEEAPGN